VLRPPKPSPQDRDRLSCASPNIAAVNDLVVKARYSIKSLFNVNSSVFQCNIIDFTPS